MQRNEFNPLKPKFTIKKIMLSFVWLCFPDYYTISRILSAYVKIQQIPQNTVFFTFPMMYRK